MFKMRVRESVSERTDRSQRLGDSSAKLLLSEVSSLLQFKKFCKEKNTYFF